MHSPLADRLAICPDAEYRDGNRSVELAVAEQRKAIEKLKAEKKPYRDE